MSNEMYKAFDEAMQSLERLEALTRREHGNAHKRVHDVYVNLDIVQDKLLGNIA